MNTRAGTTLKKARRQSGTDFQSVRQPAVPDGSFLHPRPVPSASSWKRIQANGVPKIPRCVPTPPAIQLTTPHSAIPTQMRIFE